MQSKSTQPSRDNTVEMLKAKIIDDINKMADQVNVEKRRLTDEKSAAQQSKLEAVSKLQEVEQVRRSAEQAFADLAAEKAAFAEEKMRIADMNASSRDILRLNVGG